VRAILVQQAEAAIGIAKDHKVLSQEPGADRRAIGLGNFLCHAGRNPMPPHELTHRSITLNAAEQFIFLGSKHGGSPQA
jgi:hypothetical protein